MQGLREGWQYGFEDGYKQGIRRIYQEAKELNMDVTILQSTLIAYLSDHEKR